MFQFPEKQFIRYIVPDVASSLAARRCRSNTARPLFLPITTTKTGRNRMNHMLQIFPVDLLPSVSCCASRGSAIDRRYSLLRSLGAEIARLHRCGFVHGDLTPFNTFIVKAQPPRFVLSDHERRGRMGRIGRRRRAVRNLVRL